MRSCVRFVAVIALASSLALALPAKAGTPQAPLNQKSLNASSWTTADLLAKAWAYLRSLLPDEGCGGDPSGGKACNSGGG